MVSADDSDAIMREILQRECVCRCNFSSLNIFSMLIQITNKLKLICCFTNRVTNQVKNLIKLVLFFKLICLFIIIQQNEISFKACLKNFCHLLSI